MFDYYRNRPRTSPSRPRTSWHKDSYTQYVQGQARSSRPLSQETLQDRPESALNAYNGPQFCRPQSTNTYGIENKDYQSKPRSPVYNQFNVKNPYNTGNQSSGCCNNHNNAHSSSPVHKGYTQERKPERLTCDFKQENRASSPICSHPSNCCVHKHLHANDSHVMATKMADMQEDADCAEANKNYIVVRKPLTRNGRLGAEWRHIKSCYSMNGNHMVWIDGVVKEYENTLYPLIRPKNNEPRLVTHRPRNLSNIFHTHAKEGFKYWDTGDNKNKGLCGNRNNNHWLGVSSGDNLAGMLQPVRYPACIQHH